MNESREIVREVRSLYKRFVRSKYYRSLDKRHKEFAKDVIELTAEFMYDYFLQSPNNWIKRDLIDCLVNIFPRKVSEHLIFFESVVPVLINFVKFLGEDGKIRRADRIVTALRKSEHLIIKNANDPDRWGMAKTILMTLMAFEMEISDENLRLATYLWNLLQSRLIPEV